MQFSGNHCSLTSDFKVRYKSGKVFSFTAPLCTTKPIPAAKSKSQLPESLDGISSSEVVVAPSQSLFRKLRLH